MNTTVRASKKEAQAVLKALHIQTKPWVDLGYKPKLIMDWDWHGDGGVPSIVWEEGPYDWPVYFPHGGIEEEFGFHLPDVSGLIPDGVWVEGSTHFAVSIWKEAA